MNDWEEKRKEYIPKKIKVLFIGESAPGNDRFFYSDTMSKYDGLFRYTMKAIYNISITAGENKKNQLIQFQEDGYFLIDFFTKPGLKMNSTTRKDIESFISKLKILPTENHVLIIFTAKKIFDKIGGLFSNYDRSNILSLPFAGNGSQNEYVEHLGSFLKDHGVI